MKTSITNIAKATLIAATALMAAPAVSAQDGDATQKIAWGDFKLYIDPGHSGRENGGLWGYSEAEKTLRVALGIENMLKTYTDIADENVKLCRYDDNTVVGLEERSDEANAYGADFFYCIHSDASSDPATPNEILLLFGGWRNNGVAIEKEPKGGKVFGDILEPNLAGAMGVKSRGNWHDRCWYDKASETHENQYPYLSVNRRTNMASILSEAGYHTIASQQQRNINNEYKRIEALAGFQTIMKYRNLEVPSQTMLTGVVSNSENNQPLNGATIKVQGTDLVYNTDTYEGLFHKYTKNPNLIHNGFYLFEGLEAGKEYTLEFSAPGFEPATKSVTILAGGETSADYITHCDIALTNTMPAIVSSVSLSDLSSVDAIEPLIITFSRNMIRETVDQALSIDNDGIITTEWINDYTLKINVNQLEALWEYTIKIDGSIARNSQTNMLLDGDNDGVEGGDYLLTFTMAEPDTEAPYVVSTYPDADGEALYTQRPPVRIEFNETLVWNDDEDHTGLITVKDATGKVYEGTITHAVIGGASVLHFLTHEDYATDCAVLVTLADGLTDLSGNVGTGTSFRFLTEYREKTSATVIHELKDETDFWAPGGSGSSKGFIKEECASTSIGASPFYGVNSSFLVVYSFDPDHADENWHMRVHNPAGAVKIRRDKNDGFITMWVYGDGSNRNTGVYMRIFEDNGLAYKADQLNVNFRGWGLMVWDIDQDEIAHLVGENGFGSAWYLDAIYLTHEYTDPDDEDTPYQPWSGQIAYHNLEYSKWSDAERKAQITDIDLPDGVESVVAGNLNVKVNGNYVSVISDEAVKCVDIYNVAGAKVASAAASTVSIASLPAGVYVVKAATASDVKTVKFVK